MVTLVNNMVLCTWKLLSSLKHSRHIHTVSNILLFKRWKEVHCLSCWIVLITLILVIILQYMCIWNHVLDFKYIQLCLSIIPSYTSIKLKKRLWYINTRQCYSSIRRKEIQSFVTRWMDLEAIMLSEKEKDKDCMILLICEIWKENHQTWDFPGGPVVKTLPSNAWDVDLISCQGPKVPPSLGYGQKLNKTKQKQTRRNRE